MGGKLGDRNIFHSRIEGKVKGRMRVESFSIVGCGKVGG